MRASLTLAVLLSGCMSSYYPPGSYSPGPPAFVWFQAMFGVGKQCIKADWEPEFVEKQKRIKTRLAGAGIEIYEEQATRSAACRSCDCSAFTGWYYFRVSADMEDQVLQLGYSLSEPPPKNYRN